MSRIIFLHGVGSSGDGIRGLATALGVVKGGHCPDGPEPFDMGPGRQWFSVRGITEVNRPARIAAALPDFRAMVADFGPTEDSVLVGFSQGAIMALHAVADGLAVKAVFALSGRLAGSVPARAVWPTITLLHGTDDSVIPADMARATEGWLRQAGAIPEVRLFEGLGHSIDDRGLAILREGLAET